MGFFNLFRPPLKIKDDTFGELKYSKWKDPSKNFFEGEAVFAPLQKIIGLTIEASETGPTKSQKDFYRAVEERYMELTSSIIPLLNMKLVDWYAGNSIEDFEKEFDLESLSLPRIDNHPVKWSIVYVAKKIKHWATIDIIEFEPMDALIDG